jgi:hypothetical protein
MSSFPQNETIVERSMRSVVVVCPFASERLLELGRRYGTP